MAKPQEVRLREFLKNTNLAVSKSPPWVHSTASSRLLSILQQEKLLAVKCNVFKKDKLCYLFVGRAAYKGRESLNPEPWQLPTVFVMRFDTSPPIKRIYPFDSGAFDRNKIPEYLTLFDMENFELGTAPEVIGRLISFYFDTSRRYVDRRALDEDKLKENHVLDMRHAEIMALGKLYREGSTKNYDDRAAAIEVQVEQDIQLKKENLLGVVLPEEYLRTPGVRDTLKQLTSIIEPYGLLPLSLREHYSAIYQGVNQVYKKAGINI